MMIYILIGLSLTLASLTGLQFFYMAYLERLNKERKKRIYELECHSKHLSKRLNDAERRIVEQNDLIETIFDDFAEEEEVWADVIEDR
jgi:16S rRNA C1402 (ribose-2'-O) methylase RsmI